jgi:uncharacterized iron-regulated membrane protein
LADVVFVLILLAFFGLALLFVRACDRIIGPDEQDVAGDGQPAPTEQAAA